MNPETLQKHIASVVNEHPDTVAQVARGQFTALSFLTHEVARVAQAAGVPQAEITATRIAMMLFPDIMVSKFDTGTNPHPAGTSEHINWNRDESLLRARIKEAIINGMEVGASLYAQLHIHGKLAKVVSDEQANKSFQHLAAQPQSIGGYTLVGSPIQ